MADWSARRTRNPAVLGHVSRKSRQLFGPEIKYSNRNIRNKGVGPGQQTTPFCFTNR